MSRLVIPFCCDSQEMCYLFDDFEPDCAILVVAMVSIESKAGRESILVTMRVTTRDSK